VVRAFFRGRAPFQLEYRSMPSSLPIPLIDAAAIAWFLILVGAYWYLAGRGRLRARSIVGPVQDMRVQWMLNMANRENRLIDAFLMNALGQGNAFFASTSAIAIGGLAAILPNGERARTALEGLPMVDETSPLLWDIKVIFLIAIFVYAFFKFAWAYRLSHYTAILIGAAPIETDNNLNERENHGRLIAELIGIAADHANAGLRSYYYAMAGFTWFLHPALFIAATAWVLAILVRRDFYSRSRSVIAEIAKIRLL
jgi:uncharacterized membrane protein